MKQLFLVAVLSALASSALTVLLSSALRPPPAPRAGPAMSASDFKAALSDLEREVAALRREIAEMAVAAPAGREPVSRSPEAETPASSPASAPAESAPQEAKTRLSRFQEVFPREPDTERDYALHRANVRRWVFRGEREVLEWFGVPDSVSENEGGGETWIYEVPTGEKDEEGYPVTEQFWIRLNRGRLIDMGD